MVQDAIQRNMQEATKSDGWRNNMSMIVGVVVILIGVAFLSAILARSDMANLIPIQTIPILVFLGGVIMTGAGKATEGLGLMVLGLLFILRNMGIVSTEIFDMIWFGLLVLGGLGLVLRAKARKTS